MPHATDKYASLRKDPKVPLSTTSQGALTGGLLGGLLGYSAASLLKKKAPLAGLVLRGGVPGAVGGSLLGGYLTNKRMRSKLEELLSTPIARRERKIREEGVPHLLNVLTGGVVGGNVGALLGLAAKKKVPSVPAGILGGLLGIIAGNTLPDSGSVNKPKETTIGYLEQEIASFSRRQLLDDVANASTGIGQLAHKMQVLQEELAESADGDNSKALLRELGEL